VARDLQEKFAIGHATVQIELADGGTCALQPDNVV
jgi:hypothetical protein